jgi:hypothetical protein
MGWVIGGGAEGTVRGWVRIERRGKIVSRIIRSF